MKKSAKIPFALLLLTTPAAPQSTGTAPIPVAPGLTPRAALHKLAAVQMLEVRFPTTDGRTQVLISYTELNADRKLLVRQLNLSLPPQPPPSLTAPADDSAIRDEVMAKLKNERWAKPVSCQSGTGISDCSLGLLTTRPLVTPESITRIARS